LRTVVVGASSGLGRCIGVGLTQRGAKTALLARRLERLEAAAKEAGPGTLALACDVTSTESCRSAIDAAAAHLGGIDALVYTTNGVAVYLSSVSASLTPPWPGLGAYAVSKAALDKLVEAFRAEHPSVGFTRLVVGDCAGGEGDSMTGFADDWDHERAVEFGTEWAARKYLSDSLIEVDELVTVVDSLIRHGGSLSLHSVTVAPRTTPQAAPAPRLS
jgi:NAD(P)-dependent dehydrogenase (short-subunit alcohol dehydrogenase family)